MIGLLSPCRRHHAALVDFVDRRERGPGTSAALDHLSRCSRCERELAELALTMIALRRAGRELALVPVPTADRTRLLARSAPPRDRWGWRLQLGGLMASAAIVALMIIPGGLAPSMDGARVPTADRTSAVSSWRAAETRLAATADVPSYPAIGTMPPRYPEGQARPWKEVPSTDASRREFELQ